jgi:D-glycero-D-manno-heptose 1,7-bisphosphate phosphatase
VSRGAVFLDRDGVLNRAFDVDGTPHPPSSTTDLEILPGVAQACGRLSQAGFVLLVVTNQPDIARGTVARETVDALNAHLVHELPLAEVLMCPHDDADGCACRKPLPGLLVEGARRHGVDLTRSYMVGDRWRDIEAGRGAGCATVLVDRGYAERRAEGYDVAVGDLVEAASWILAHDATRTEKVST